MKVKRISVRLRVLILETLLIVMSVALPITLIKGQPPPPETTLLQDIQVFPTGEASMEFYMDIPEPFAGLYRESFFSPLPPYDPEAETLLPATKLVPEIIEVGEGVRHVVFLGDITGGTSDVWDFVQDGKVDIKDIGLMAKLFGVSFPDPRYKAECDITGPTAGVADGKIDIRDIAAAAKDFGKTTSPYPPPPVKTEEPVGSLFSEAVEMEQLILLGFDTYIINATIVPWGVDNETRIWMEGYSPHLAEQVDTSTWHVSVGPSDDTASETAAEFILTKIEFSQQMFQYLGVSGSQLNWTMVMVVPGTITNDGDINGLSWAVDLNGTCFLNADVIVDTNINAVIVHETMEITDLAFNMSDINMDDYLRNMTINFEGYKTFDIYYECSTGFSSQVAMENGICTIGDDWSTSGSYTISPGSYEKSWESTTPSATAKIKITPTLDITWFFGWSRSKSWKWVIWPIFGYSVSRLEWFRTWFEITPSIKVEGYVGVGAPFEQTWEHTFATWSRKKTFFVGFVVVFVEIKLEITGGVTINADLQVGVTITSEVKNTFKAGVEWVRGTGWSGTWSCTPDATMDADYIADASCSITPFARCRLSFLLYYAAGPFVEAKPYLPIEYDLLANNWSIELRFKVIAGVTFNERLRTAIGLDEWSTELADILLYKFV